MKKIAKNLAMVSLAAMMGLAGCSTQQAAEKPAEGDSVEVKEPVEITFWHVYSENFGAPVIKAMVDEFNSSQDDIRVKEVYNPDMYPGLMQNLQAEVAAGNPPSVCMIGYNYIKYFAANFNYISPQDLIE